MQSKLSLALGQTWLNLPDQEVKQTRAIRIARASSGKDNVAFCGYHGWHDWYLSSNINTKNNLEGHLLPGLSHQGCQRRSGDCFSV